MSDTPDMLVQLNQLPQRQEQPGALKTFGIEIRRVDHGEQRGLYDWVEQRFGTVWADGIGKSAGREPIAAFVGVSKESYVGVVLYNCGSLGTLGPMGVDEGWRGQGIGAALLLTALDEMRNLGYSYVIIPEVGPEAFYEKVCGATVIVSR